MYSRGFPPWGLIYNRALLGDTVGMGTNSEADLTRNRSAKDRAESTVAPPEGRDGGRRKSSGASRADVARRAKGTRQLVGLSAAAAYADVSTRTLRRYIAQGRLTGYRVGPRLVRSI
jgi:hypothetical protein